jgi:uncharacterized protein
VLVALNQIRNPLRFNVGFLIHEPIGTSRDIHFDFPELRLNPDLDLKELHGVVRVGKTPQGILLQASFNAMVDAECVRCLASFEQPLHTDFSELFAFTPRSVSESGLVLPEDGYIQFEPLVREYILVEVPIRPLCREDCKGLCQVCGEDLNESTCEHEQRVPLD